MVVLEVQQRLGDDISRATVSLVRAGFGVMLAPDLSLLAGYHFQRNSPAGLGATNEHRVWQQAILPIVRHPERLLVTARLRLEQRSIEGSQDLGWRGRALLRAQVPLNGRGSAGPLLWTQALLPLNDTDWGQRRRIHQLRFFAGAAVPLGPRLNLEAGYLVRTDALTAGTRVAHIANLQLNYRIGD